MPGPVREEIVGWGSNAGHVAIVGAGHGLQHQAASATVTREGPDVGNQAVGGNGW